MRSISSLLVLLGLLFAACGTDKKICKCPSGVLCLPNGTCESSEDPPPTCSQEDRPVGTPELTVQHSLLYRGVHTVGETVRFTVPSNAVSLEIVEQAVSAPEYVTYGNSINSHYRDNVAVPLDLYQGTTRVFSDRASVSDSADIVDSPAFFAGGGAGIGTFIMPNTTGGLGWVSSPGLAGEWTMVVSDYAYECAIDEFGLPCLDGASESRYDVAIIARVAGATPAIPSTGTVDVVIYPVTVETGGADLPSSATDVARDPDIVRMVSTLKQIFAPAGITLNVSFRDVAQSVKDEYAEGVDVGTIGPCSPLAQLLKNAEPGPVLSVFLVSEFHDGSGDRVVGMDGTIPGPATIGGTVASGAAVGTADLRAGTYCPSSTPNYKTCGDDRTAYIIAHEMGHFLGLYHVTEQSGVYFDPLSDTPECSCSKCYVGTETCRGDGSGHRMSLSECTATAECAGGDNLMFYLFSSEGEGSVPNLSDEQKTVIRANPLVH